MWHMADGTAILEASPSDRGRFDSFVRAHTRAHPLQLWSWGEVKKGDGWRPRRFVIDRRGEILATASVVERQLPVPGRPRFWLAHRGPVGEPAARETELLWRGLREVALADGVVALRCDPEWPVAEKRWLRHLVALPPRPEWPSGALEPIRVWRISLDGGEQAVFGRFEAHTRQDVRRAGKKGATVRVGSHADLAAFHAMERATAERKGFSLRDLGFFERLWQAWREHGRLFIAEHEGRIIGGAWFVVCGAGCWGQYAASDPEHRRLLPAVLCYWAGVQWAIRQGCRFCDFGGIDWRPGRPDGLRDFKKGFGPGDLRFVGEHDLVARPAAYRAFRLAEEARWAYFNAKARRPLKEVAQ